MLTLQITRAILKINDHISISICWSNQENGENKTYPLYWCILVLVWQSTQSTVLGHEDGKKAPNFPHLMSPFSNHAKVQVLIFLSLGIVQDMSDVSFFVFNRRFFLPVNLAHLCPYSCHDDKFWSALSQATARLSHLCTVIQPGHSCSSGFAGLNYIQVPVCNRWALTKTKNKHLQNMLRCQLILEHKLNSWNKTNISPC